MYLHRNTDIVFDDNFVNIANYRSDKELYDSEEIMELIPT
jgi:hypothetical protein